MSSLVGLVDVAYVAGAAVIGAASVDGGARLRLGVATVFAAACIAAVSFGGEFRDAAMVTGGSLVAAAIFGAAIRAARPDSADAATGDIARSGLRAAGGATALTYALGGVGVTICVIAFFTSLLVSPWRESPAARLGFALGVWCPSLFLLAANGFLHWLYSGPQF